MLQNLFNRSASSDIQLAIRKTVDSTVIAGIMAKQGEINGVFSKWKLICLGSLIRLMKPEVVVETGVAHGSSSAVILEALYENGRGTLYSIDLPVFKGQDGKLKPWLRGYSFKAEDVSTVRDLDQVGWLVPSDLRDQWKLVLGDSLTELPKLLPTLPEVNLFLHDSLHHYEHMTQEFELIWPCLTNGGFLLADDIFLKRHLAVPDFANRHGGQAKNYLQLGMVRKLENT
ncbi:MAG: class I SAM-dependent methyltransferase [Candidatus Omnitrophica bacterium]|nr:class I SAM-dependent methyltransferase [Candidatus Omnitrophota bacterium]